MDASILIALISVSFSSLTAFMTALFHSMSLSRCKTIDCCCVKCSRDVLDDDTYLEAQQHNNE